MGAVGSFRSNILTWTNADNVFLAAVEVWASQTNNRATATMVGCPSAIKNSTQQGIHGGLSSGATWYYWLRTRSNSGSVGDFQPANPLAGVSATTQASAAGGRGTAILDFGVIGGSSSFAFVEVTGETEIGAGARLLVDKRLVATADHSVDEVQFEGLKLTAGAINPGVGFTIYGEVVRGRTYGAFPIDWIWF